MEPSIEAGYLDELFDIDELANELIPLRAEILDGDLRPLYLAHLAVLHDMNHDPEDAREGPVPAGLDKLTAAQSALAQFNGLSDHFIAAVAEGCQSFSQQSDRGKLQTEWIENQPEQKKNAWLAELISDAGSTVQTRDPRLSFKRLTGRRPGRPSA